MKSIIYQKIFTRAVFLHIQRNPGCTREEIRSGLPENAQGSVLSSTVTLLRHKLIRQQGGKPATFFAL